MDRKVRWGILGYAGIARNHVIPAMMEAGNAEVVAIASRSREKLKEAVERFGFRKVYESYDRLLEDPEIDAVYIPLPNALHKEWAIKAARHGKHVLCEKPLASNAREARQMVAVARECGVTGARMMGGGFGGCTINLVKDDLFADFIATAKRKFTERFGHEPKVYPVVISDGAHKID